MLVAVCFLLHLLWHSRSGIDDFNRPAIIFPAYTINFNLSADNFKYPFYPICKRMLA